MMVHILFIVFALAHGARQKPHQSKPKRPQPDASASFEIVGDSSDFESLVELPPTPNNVNQSFAEECRQINWKEHWMAIMASNLVLELSQHTETVQTIREFIDPIHVSTSIPLNMEVSFFGTKYRMEMVTGSISFHGLNSIKLHPIKALTETQLGLKVGVKKLTAKAQMDVKFIPISSEPDADSTYAGKTWEAKVEFHLVDPSINVVADIRMYRCTGTWWERIKCMGRSLWSYIKALGTFRLFTELYGRFESMYLHKFEMDFLKTEMHLKLLKHTTPSGEHRTLYANTQQRRPPAWKKPPPKFRPTEPSDSESDSDISFEESDSYSDSEAEPPRFAFASRPTRPAPHSREAGLVKEFKKVLDGKKVQGSFYTMINDSLSKGVKDGVNQAIAKISKHFHARCYRRLNEEL